MIVLMAGLPGTGKSTLAKELAARTRGRVISKDEIRQAIFTADEIEYSTQQDDFCMQIMLRTAAHLLEREPSRMIFLDGRTFSQRYQIENVITFAEALHQPWRILECVCSEATAGKRLEEDARAGSHPAANRDLHLYQEVRSHFEAITCAKTEINTDQPLTRCAEQALKTLAS